MKWTALSFFVAFIVLGLVWDRGAYKAAGVASPDPSGLERSLPFAIGSLVLAPIGAYLLTYLGWFVGENGWGGTGPTTTARPRTLHLLGLSVPWTWAWVPAPIRALGSWTLQAYRFHEGLDSGHAYQSNPWNWWVLGRPVDFYYDGNDKACGSSSCSREILLIGTPLLWWAFIPAMLWLAWHYVTTRDWRAAAVWVAFAAGWLVWFQDLKRTMFLFYMAPLIPFLILALTHALGVMFGARSEDAAGRLALHPASMGDGGRFGLPRSGDRRLRVDVADLHRRLIHLRHLARAYVAAVVGMSRTCRLPQRSDVHRAAIVTGAFILNSGLGKLKADETTAKNLHAMASNAYPVLTKVPPKPFAKALAISEVVLGGAAPGPARARRPGRSRADRVQRRAAGHVVAHTRHARSPQPAADATGHCDRQGRVDVRHRRPACCSTPRCPSRRSPARRRARARHEGDDQGGTATGRQARRRSGACQARCASGAEITGSQARVATCTTR